MKTRRPKMSGVAVFLVVIIGMLVMPSAAADTPQFDDVQVENARVVYEVGTELEASDRAMLAAFEAGLVESEMRLDLWVCEQDHDSAGVFQQRRDWVPAAEAPASEEGWCTSGSDPRLDSRWAATGFFTGSAGHPGALHYDEVGVDYDDEPIETAGDLAQAVQVSALPDEYERRRDDALSLLRLVSSGGGDDSDSQPYTAAQVCGEGFDVIDEADLDGAGTVFLLWKGITEQNCVVTLKSRAVGTPSTVTAYLEPADAESKSSSGDYSYYAGPVRATAPACVKWGGSIEGSSYRSGWEHCSGATPPQTQPYTAAQVCGEGFDVIDEADLDGAGTVFLLWKGSTEQNCVVTLKSRAVGTPSTVTPYLEPADAELKSSSGDYSYYAGPIRATAPACVKWGGSIEGSSYRSGWEHCSGATPPQAQPTFQLPFPCGQRWTGQTRVNHRPQLSIDFNRAGDLGDDVVASATGTVSAVKNLGNQSYGRYVDIDHGGGWTTRYAHLQSWSVSLGNRSRRNAT